MREPNELLAQAEKHLKLPAQVVGAAILMGLGAYVALRLLQSLVVW